MLANISPEILSSRLMSRNIKIRIYRYIIFPVNLYGYETL
jgi:hypothetical protein